MREDVVVASSRTPLAKSFRGSLNLTRPDDQLAHCIKDALRKTPQVDHSEVEDVIAGCGYPAGVQGSNIARVAALLAGLPVTVAGVTVNRFCSSGLQAVAMAAHQIVSEAGIFAPNVTFTEFAARKLSNPRFRGIGSSPANPVGVTPAKRRKARLRCG